MHLTAKRKVIQFKGKGQKYNECDNRSLCPAECLQAFATGQLPFFCHIAGRGIIEILDAVASKVVSVSV